MRAHEVLGIAMETTVVAAADHRREHKRVQLLGKGGRRGRPESLH